MHRRPLATTEVNYDAAFVVIQDGQAWLPDPINPYLHAKATLLMHGIVSQRCRVSTISAPESDLQWKLPNIGVAMYVKLGDTVDGGPGANADDETWSAWAWRSCQTAGSRNGRTWASPRCSAGTGTICCRSFEGVSYDQYPGVLPTITSLLEDLGTVTGGEPATPSG